MLSADRLILEALDSLLIIGFLARHDHGIELGYHDGTLRDGTELSPGQLIDKVTKGEVALLLSFGLLG